MVMASYAVSTVRRGLLKRKKVADALTTLGEVCKAGAQCKAVQASKVVSGALDGLTAAVGTAGTSLATVLAKTLELAAAKKDLKRDMADVTRCLSLYESSVDAYADGDGAVIAAAGLPSRQNQPPAALGKVVKVIAAPGKNPTEGVIRWPRAPGATGYAIQVCLAPESPTPSWIEVAGGTGRRRVLKGPAPGAQFLARVASVASDGTRSEWSDPVLVTAR
jgi:hypothetical protein